MQTEFKQLNPTTREIVITVETERVDAAYDKYLQKSARVLEVPGFRKGKAPLSMVTRMYSDRIKDHFEKDFVDEAFTEATREHDIHFLLYPEVKEIEWEQGSEMKITLEIEHEPPVELKQLDNLQVPFKPRALEEEVDRFIATVAREHATVQDVEEAADGDLVQGHLTAQLESGAFTRQTTVTAGARELEEFPGKLVGTRTGDKLEAQVPGLDLERLYDFAEDLSLDRATLYACSFETGQVTRTVVADIDDEFAKDMDFETLAEMKAKIADDMKLRVEHSNIDSENSAILAKLFHDNQFPLPTKTLRHIVNQELGNIDPKFQQALQSYVIDKVVQDMTSLYLLNALQKQSGLEHTEAMTDAYVEHKAILKEINPQAYRAQNADLIAGEDFKEGALNYHILRGIAATCTFVEPKPEAEQTDDTEFEVVEDTPDQEEKA